MEVVIAVCGAGGKTTKIYQLKEFYVKLGKKVAILTTTHMAWEPYCITDGNRDRILERFKTDGWVFVGEDCKNGKVKNISKDLYEFLTEKADILLVEADGSRHHSVKIPNETDVQIPENVTKILVIMGIFEIGKPLEETVHRYERMPQMLRKDAVLSMELIRKIAAVCYEEPLKKRYPEIPVCVEYASGDPEKRTVFGRDLKFFTDT